MTGPVYYTNEMTRLPWRVFLKLALPRDVSGLLGFLVLAFRKMIGLPYAPSSAAKRPESIPFVEWDMIPRHARDAMEGPVAQCEEAGMRLVCYTKGQYIGKREGYNATLLSGDGVACTTVAWFRIQVGSLENARVVVACHTTLQNGRTLDSSAWGDLSPRIQELCMPREHEVLYLPADTCVAGVIRGHRERLESNSGERPVVFDDASLVSEMLKVSQRVFDHQIRQGLLVPLSQAEADALMSAVPSGKSFPPPLKKDTAETTEASRRLAGRKALMKLSIWILLMGALWFFLFHDKALPSGYTRARDRRSVQALSTRPHIEAKEWAAKHEEVYFGNLDADETAQMLDELYKHEADAIYMVDPDSDPATRASYANTMIVRLPKDADARKVFFSYEEELLRKKGLSGDPATGDLGQKYLFVSVD